MMIKEIKRSNLQNMEHFQFASHVAALCDEANIELVNAVLEPLQKAIEQEDKALNQPRREEGTQELEELDRARDRAYRALQLLVEMHACSENADMRKAAQQMDNVMSRYPKLVTANYDKESGMVKNLITDLRAAELTAAVTKLTAAAHITRLATANEQFDQRYRSRLKGGVPSGTFDLKALRSATDKALNAVIRRMDSLDDLEPETPKLADLITQYNGLVEKRRMTLAHRAGTSQTARDKRKAEYDAMLKKGFAALEERLNLEKGSLSFTGKTEGTGSKRHYQLAIKGQTEPDGTPKMMWVGVNKDGSLYIVEKTKTTTTKPAVGPKP